HPGSFTAKYNLVIVMFIIAILLSLIFYMIPLGAFSKINEPVVIYFADNITPAHEKIIDQFNNNYSDRVKVIPIDIPFSKFSTNERKELIARTLRNSNNRIDIFTVDQIWVSRFAKWAKPLSRYFSRKEIDRIIPVALKTCYDERVLVGIPLHIDIGVMYYRKDLLNKFNNPLETEQSLKNSITWDEFIGLKRKLKTSNPFYVFQGENYEGLVLQFMEISGSGLGRFITGDSISLQQPELIQSCSLLVKLVNKYGLSPPEVTSFNENLSYAYAFKNDAVFFRGWPGLLREASNFPGGKEKAGLLGVASLPRLDGNDPVSALGGWNLMISENSGKVEEAVLFLKYILSDEAQKILYETAGFLPVLKSVYDDTLFTENNIHLTYFRKLIEQGIYRPAHPEYTKLSTILSGYLYRAINKELSPEEALRSAEQEINAQISFDKTKDYNF
ncbi:MAG: extracellular solute-binding protein, partial [Calditrichaceae bacterium]